MVLEASKTARWANEAREEEVRRWVRVVHRLPSVRVEKVVAVREALRQNRYDNEHILEEMINRLGNDVGILCRRQIPGPQSSGFNPSAGRR
jgi:predicted metal-dependent RNase